MPYTTAAIPDAAKLDLIQFAPCEVAEAGAGAPQVVRGQLVHAGACRAARTTSHSTFGDMPSPQTRPALLIARNTGPCVTPAAAIRKSAWSFTHIGMGTVRTCPPLPTRSAITHENV